MKTVINNNSWPVTLVGPDKRQHVLPPGVPTSVDEDVLARYERRPDWEEWVRTSKIIIGADSLTGKQKDAVQETRELESKVRKEAEAKMPGTSMTKAQLLEQARDLGLDLDEKMTKADIAVAIELALGEPEPPPLQPGEAKVPSVSPPPPMDG